MPTIEKHEVGTPTWMDLMTLDLEKARTFYGALFGWTFDIGPKEADGYTLCKLGGRTVAGLGMKPPDQPRFAVWNLYFEVDDVDAACARVEKLGGKVVMKPRDVPDSHRIAFCVDPTGATFGLWQSRQHTGAQVVAEPGAMVWHEVLTRDAPRDKAFYTKLLGLQESKLEDMDYWALNKGRDVVAGVMQMGDAWSRDVPPNWMNYFAVEDTDATARRVAELGGAVKQAPVDSPYGRFAVVSDSQGGVFTIVKPTRPS
ncbi:VOC family protein [Myxococcus sp. K15C18031901]|uniref:VOC family protein n=1 Tax=Myxococcus dinghuensis TaxID=2906761 RepID=UPI0020A82C0B|nr:VOC family protein [Myxococcus dinghuensis]MCP3100694.1 VOC family protein [Myxococcus dinghuensis]